MQAEATFVVRAPGCGAGRWWSWWVASLAALAVAGSWLAAGVQPAPRVTSGAAVPADRTFGLGALSRLSVQAQSVISSAVGSGDPRFQPRRQAGGFALAGGGVTAGLGRGGVSVGGGGERLSLALAGVGRGARVSPLPAVAPRVRADRVVYLRGDGVREWYAAGPLGVEQGFALARRPAGRSGAVSLALTIAGLRARLRGSGMVFLARSGQVAVRYGGLVAVDARGRRLPAWFSLSGSRLLLQVADRGARYPLRIDPLVQEAELMPDGALDFGWSVAADGNTIVVGAPGTMVGSNALQGAVYVFVGSGGVWKEQQELTASDGATPDQLGNSVAISGDTVVAGAWGVRRGENFYQGAAYVFVRNGTTWIEQAELTASDLGNNANFGYSVGVADDTAVVGAPGAPDNRGVGRAYIFVRRSGVWAQTAELVPPQADTLCAQFCLFGWSVAILHGSRYSVVVGAPFAGNESGAAFFFFGSDATWSAPQKLVPAAGTAGEQLGYSVAIGVYSGNLQEVDAGAPLATVNGQGGKGAVYAFRGTAGGGWASVRRTSYFGVAGENFGASTAFYGTTTVVGAAPIPCQYNCSDHLLGRSQSQGAAYVSPGDATKEQKLTAKDGAVGDDFGLSVATSGNLVVVGARDASGTSTRLGAAYVFAPAAAPLTSTAPAGQPKLRLVVSGPRAVTAGRIARYRVILSLTQIRNRRASPVRNVRVLSTHAGRRVGRWLVSTLLFGRSRTLRLKVAVPGGARGRFCISTTATAKGVRGASLRYCAPIAT